MNPGTADERIAYGGDPNQFFDVYDAKGTPRGTAVMIHGGFWRSRWDLSNASNLCRGLSRAGYQVASLEYRRVGETGGGWPETFEDVVAGFHAAREKMGPAMKPVVAGHSAGGHLALRLAVATDAMAGVVALAPAAVLQLGFRLHLGSGATEEFLGGAPEAIPDVYEAACPSRHASCVRRILLHGSADDVVPLEVSEAFLAARAADAGRVELVRLEGVDHMELIDPESRTWPAVLAAFETLRG